MQRRFGNLGGARRGVQEWTAQQDGDQSHRGDRQDGSHGFRHTQQRHAPARAGNVVQGQQENAAQAQPEQVVARHEGIDPGALRRVDESRDQRQAPQKRQCSKQQPRLR